MAKGSSNLRGRTSDASKPYDVSNSFVKRVASRVTELLPQPSSWLSRWMTPPSLPNVSDYTSLPTSSTTTSRPPATSRAELNLVDNVDNHIPTKRARTGSYSSPSNQKPFLRNVHGAEDLSPIAVRGEPVAVPSCSKDHPEMIASTPAQAQNANKVNGDDCSETSESTSGCSSLVPQAQSTTRSMGGGRYGRSVHPGTHNPDLLQRRGPSFSTTTFSSSLRTSMRERGTSPFYSGRTMYGGSSQAYLMTALHSPQRRVGPTVKPIPAPQSLPLSATAKRILDALEQFSTPVLDAKRMPVVGSKRKLEGSQRYTELSIPTTPELLRVKRRERLQQSTSAARHAATVTASAPAPAPAAAPAPVASTVYSLRQEDEDLSWKKHTGKVKTKEKVDEELAVEVKLPAAVLSLASLPKIDIPIPPPPTHTTSALTTSRPSGKFKFASPTPVSHCESSLVPVVRNTLTVPKFSVPICEPSGKPSVDIDLSKPVVLSDSLSLRRTNNDNLSSQPRKRKSRDESSSEDLAHGKESSLKTNIFDSLNPSSTSCLQPDNRTTECKTCLKRFNNSQLSCSLCESQNNNSTNDKIVSTTSHWVCSTCKKENPSSTAICVNCQTKEQPKSLDTNKNHIKSPTAGFGNLFKKPAGTWECSTCMIQNKGSATVCIACESAKPSESKKPSTGTTMESTATAATTTSVMTSGTSSFGNQTQLNPIVFKKPSGSWDCESCLLVNKPNTSKCVACETPKPGVKVSDVPKSEASSVSKEGFGNMFKKPPGSWSCEMCMLTNSAEKDKCVACETTKPGATLTKTKESSQPKFSFGIPASSSGMSTTFCFGIPKTDSSVTSNTTTNFSKSISSSDSSQSVKTSQTFSFGIPKPENVNTTGVAVTTSQPVFSFGSTLQSKTTESKTPVVNAVKKVTSEILIDSAKSELSSLTNAASMSVPRTAVSIVKSTPPINEKPALSEEKASTATPAFSFSANKVAQNTNNKPSEINLASSTKSSQPFCMFGIKQGNLGSSVASSTTNTISSSSASNVFKFGETKTVSSGSGVSSVSFVNTKPSFTSPKPSNMFSFGSNNEKKEITFGTTASVESQQANKVAITSSETKPTFGLFTTAQNQPPMFGTNNAFASPSFGNKEQSSNLFTSSTGIDFGATPNKSSTTTSSFPGFGQPNTFQTASQENKPSAVFSFGSAPSKEPPAAGGFAFNPAVEKQAETSFGFSAAQNSAASTKLFGFNNTTSAPSFNFEPKPFTASASPFSSTASDPPAPVFGAPASQQPPAFGDQPNPSPMFAFGSQSAQTSSNPMFEFAPNQQQPSGPVVAAPSTTFVFGATPAPAPAPALAAPAFDPNLKPTFNFSQGSTPVFSAIPTINSTGPSPAPVRKIRKAVRRTNISSVRQT